jgi:multimeric flavodoxin WrbA
MGKSVLILKASPRERGNSAALADQLAAGARTAGADVDIVSLHVLDIRPCDACDLCRENDGECVIDDDMQPLYPKLRAADAIVIATPVYWFTLSAQAKLFIDRWYALLGEKPCALPGKQFALVLTYGDEDLHTSGGIHALATFEHMVTYLRGEMLGCVHGTANDPGDVQNQPALLEEAFKLGELLGTSNIRFAS